MKLKSILFAVSFYAFLHFHRAPAISEPM